MVVADEDPPRKRSRLSLKNKKGDNAAQSQTEDPDPPPSLESAGAVPQGPVSESEQEGNDCSPPVIDLAESDLPCDGPGVPPVASMENLGNTCFLNSVLEVLRYTPCFLEGLEQLYRHIVYLEKVKATEAVQESEEVNTEPSMAWELVKNLFKMYKRMEKREETFSQFANADVTSMAVKPDKILDAIRECNPMFEGNMQHDAQELLRCLLCYLEDSERELHRDYASILALDPSLLKTPGKTPGAEKQCRNPVMENFLAAGKAKGRRGKSAVSALKFEATPAESIASDEIPAVPPGSKRANPATNLSDLLGDANQKSKEKNSSTASRQPKRGRFRHTKMRKGVEEDKSDEVDGMSMQVDSQSLASSDCQTNGTPEEQEGKLGSKNTRRSARRTVVNGLGSVSPVSRVTSKGGARSKRQGKTLDVNGEGEKKLYSDVVKEMDKSPEVKENGDHDAADKSQPTILSMFGKTATTGRQCRRLGMRGRVIRKEESTTPATLPVQNSSPEVPECFSELRRSPRKSSNARPAAMTASPRKQAGVMTSPTSPARPDEFPAHVVKGDNGSAFDPSLTSVESVSRSPITAQLWDTDCVVESPKKCFNAKDCNGWLSPIKISDDESVQTGHLEQERPSSELPDLAPAANGDDTTDPASVNVESVRWPSPSDAVKIKPETSSPVKFRSARASPSKARLASPGKLTKSPAKSDMSPLLLNGSSKDSQGGPGSSKLMIKLEKCDHLCNTPTISASAAMKALKGPSTSSTCRKMSFSGDDVDEAAANDQDSDDEEISLGTKSSFKSVPLKSVCVKVEKCDMVCSSPEKSVSARFATTCLARQRAQRFNIIEKLFQGTMMMRTKCLECERCTERKESFQDVSVPLKSEDSADSNSDTDEEKDSCLLRLMHAFTDVERLREDNKYHCEQCMRYVEAERSLHYEALPNILTVHLKRFSATGMFGCLSKINDHVAVPLMLSCLRYKCPKPCVRPDHRYTLFAIITHAGSTISSGHYLSYIKVRPNALGYDTISNYLNCTPEKKSCSVSEGEETPKKSTHTPTHPRDEKAGLANPAEVSMSPGGDFGPRRTRSDSFSEKRDVSEKGDGGCTFDSPKEKNKTRGSPQKRMRQTAAAANGDGDGEKALDADTVDYHWLECDDETIRILSESEFHERLTEKEGSLRGTPYVLFYHRLDTWRAK